MSSNSKSPNSNFVFTMERGSLNDKDNPKFKFLAFWNRFHERRNFFAGDSHGVSAVLTLIDPYTGSMAINGTALSTCEYCTCDPGCDPAPGETYEFPFSDMGEVSGSLGQIEAYISGDVGTAVFDASFKEGTVSGNTLNGILTFGSEGAVDAPFVKSVTLTKQ